MNLRERKLLRMSGNKDMGAITAGKNTRLAMVEIVSGKKTPKIIELLDKRHSQIKYAPEAIVFQNKTYKLRFPLLCNMEITAEGVTIENQSLGIYAWGKTTNEAEKMFAEEFDYIYTRYNELPNKQLTDQVIGIKYLLNHLVIA